ncbi:hypothetical protein JBE27_51590, partial [Streptomyces albiflaviniger]|nr:hypothetical protein [Streptomyces albiflaviniger]
IRRQRQICIRDRDFLRALIDHCLETGYLGAPPADATEVLARLNMTGDGSGAGR